MRWESNRHRFWAITCVRTTTCPIPLERDEGEYAYSGQSLLQGIPPTHWLITRNFEVLTSPTIVPPPTHHQSNSSGNATHFAAARVRRCVALAEPAKSMCMPVPGLEWITSWPLNEAIRFLLCYFCCELPFYE